MREFAVGFFLLLVCSLAVGGNRADPKIPDVVLYLGDSIPGNGDGEILYNASMTNTFAEITAFDITIQSSRPDILWFDFESGAIDVASTLVTDWQFVSALPVDGDSGTVRIIGLADLLTEPGQGTGIPPQSGGTLFRLYASTAQNLPYQPEPYVVDVTTLRPANFSDAEGYLLGQVTDTLVDTTYFRCAIPSGNECLEWETVDPELSSYDSIAVDTTLEMYQDPGKIVLFHARTEIYGGHSCDYNNDNLLDIGDLTYMISCLFITLGDCPELSDCDMDGDEMLDIGDVTAMIIYLFI